MIVRQHPNPVQFKLPWSCPEKCTILEAVSMATNSHHQLRFKCNKYGSESTLGVGVMKCVMCDSDGGAGDACAVCDSDGDGGSG